jgi:hypothetical protein
MIALMMEAVQTSETLVNSYQSTWLNPEDSHLHWKNFFVLLLSSSFNALPNWMFPNGALN